MIKIRVGPLDLGRAIFVWKFCVEIVHYKNITGTLYIPTSIIWITLDDSQDRVQINELQIIEVSLTELCHYTSVCMPSAVHGSHFVCVFQTYWLFPWTLRQGKCLYRYYMGGSTFTISRFAKQSLTFEIWQYLLTSKALVNAYDSSNWKAVLSRLPFSFQW